jgi:hypothetical protein
MVQQSQPIPLSEDSRHVPVNAAVGELQAEDIEKQEVAGLATKAPVPLANKAEEHPGAAAIGRDRALLATAKVKDSELTLSCLWQTAKGFSTTFH